MLSSRIVLIPVVTLVAALAMVYAHFGSTPRQTPVSVTLAPLPHPAIAAAPTSRSVEGLQAQLKASDVEWEVMEPLLYKLVTVRDAVDALANTSSAASRKLACDQCSDDVRQALSELENTLSNPYATPDQINERQLAIRHTREKAREELDAVTRELLMVLTPEQESKLVELGYLN